MKQFDIFETQVRAPTATPPQQEPAESKAVAWPSARAGKAGAGSSGGASAPTKGPPPAAGVRPASASQANAAARTDEPGAALAEHQGSGAALQAPSAAEVLPGGAVRPAGGSSATAVLAPPSESPQPLTSSAGEQTEAPSSALPHNSGLRHPADAPHNGQLSAARGHTAAMADVSATGAPLLCHLPLVLVLPPIFSGSRCPRHACNLAMRFRHGFRSADQCGVAEAEASAARHSTRHMGTIGGACSSFCASCCCVLRFCDSAESLFPCYSGSRSLNVGAMMARSLAHLTCDATGAAVRLMESRTADSVLERFQT